MENIQIINNKQFNGVEIYFNQKPNQNIITELKNKNFRWHTAKKCWYNKATEEVKKFIETLTDGESITASEVKPHEKQENILKSLTPLTEEEKINFAKSEWQDPKMQDFILKQYNYYKTTDGFIFEIEKASKLSITKTLYYDDEYDAPEINFENFEWHNKFNCNKYDHLKEKAEHEYNKFYFAINGNLKNVYVNVMNDWEFKENQFCEKITRELTADEKQDILTLYKQQKDEYTTRLQKYWNKYKNHITTYGYWANR
nr:MAG TPA: hypothetical protein [Caudoviricetes sp.]